MKKKVIAIGSRIMRDDAIGVLVGEALESDFKKLGMEVVLGETDVDYCLSSIERGDFLFILDCTCYGIQPGSISVMDIKDKGSFIEKGYSQHQFSLVKLLNSNDVQDATGFVIGIEGAEIDYGTELSSELFEKFSRVKDEVRHIVVSTVCKTEFKEKK